MITWHILGAGRHEPDALREEQRLAERGKVIVMGVQVKWEKQEVIRTPLVKSNGNQPVRHIHVEKNTKNPKIHMEDS